MEPLCDEVPVELLDSDPVRCEVRPLIISAERADRGPLMLQCGGHSTRRPILRLAFEFEQQAAADDGRLDAAEPLPALDSAVGVQHGGQRVGRHATSSEHGQQAPQNRSRGRGGLIDERGEVEECVTACEVGQGPDDQPGDAERLAHLRYGAAFHLDRVPAQFAQQPIARGVTVEVLVAGQHCAVDDLTWNRDFLEPPPDASEQFGVGRVAETIGAG